MTALDRIEAAYAYARPALHRNSKDACDVVPLLVAVARAAQRHQEACASTRYGRSLAVETWGELTEALAAVDRYATEHLPAE